VPVSGRVRRGHRDERQLPDRAFYDEAWSQDLYYSAPLQFLPGLEGAHWTGCGSGG
jgi:hypothetical protein